MKFIKGLLLLSLLSINTSIIYAQADQALVDSFAKKYAASHNKSIAEVKVILNKASFQPSIIEKMEKPAEKAMTWTKYRSIFITPDRIAAGVDFWKANEMTISEVSFESGVAPEIILGIIGVETFFGERKGSYLVLDALYTLAFGYPKRSSYFTSELEKYLELSELEKLDIYTIKGSYAGAMGYCQFMPSSYVAYAKSYDQEGNRDLVNSVDDAIASVANYLEVHRWVSGDPIAQQATASSNAQEAGKQSLKPGHSYSHFEKMGYIANDPKALVGNVSLVELETETGKEYWFGMNNFYVITRYNHSPMYALAVYQLAEAIKTKKMDME